MFERPDLSHAPLYVVTSVFNPVRYRSRWRLYQDFARHIEASGAILYTVEVAFGQRDFAVTRPDNPRHLQLRTDHELWLKENALNLLVHRLPPDWRYMAWIDADLTFSRPDWANETVQQLQHHAVLQLWSEAFDLSPTYEALTRFRSFMWCHRNDVPKPAVASGYYQRSARAGGYYWHPGFAWAMRREAFDALGGLLDWAILGGGDLFMAMALAGRLRKLPQSLGPRGRKWLELWFDRAAQQVRRDVGYVDGAVLHHWHGHKQNRGYRDRGQILIDASFDPERDLRRDWQGLWQLNESNAALRDGIRAYFRSRNEDAI
ncbi:MAG TPA: hypothetical protein VHV08_16060 [Pirellulales bacterium]|nr:hypothetical protein [Pirellulales bacterium]